MWMKKWTSFLYTPYKSFPTPEVSFIGLLTKFLVQETLLFICGCCKWLLSDCISGSHAIYALTAFIIFCSRAIQHKCTKISYSWIAWTGTWNCKIWVSIHVLSLGTIWLRKSFGVLWLRHHFLFKGLWTECCNWNIWCERIVQFLFYFIGLQETWKVGRWSTCACDSGGVW